MCKGLCNNLLIGNKERYMLRVIIADDEITTRESLREYVGWRAFGIDEVLTAKDGLDALDIAEKQKPDILVTDVRMPKMDGIALATRIREKFPDCRIIFISGYSDKEYLKSAIHLKAVSYIEKPIDLAEVESVVSQAATSYLEEENRRKNAERLQSSLKQTRPLVRQEIALDLIKGNTDIDRLSEKYDDPTLKLSSRGSFRCCCISLNWKAGVDEKAKSDFRYSILELFNKGDNFERSPIIAGITPEDTVVLILSGQTAKNPDTSGLPDTILRRVNTLADGSFTVSLGIGAEVGSISDLAQTYNQAVASLNMQFYYGSNRIYFFSSSSNRKFQAGKNLFTDFKNYLKKDDMKGALELVGRLTQSVRSVGDPDINHIRNIYFNLLLLVFEAARDKNLIGPVDENDKTYIWQEIDNIHSLSECSGYLEANISTVFSKLDNSDSVKRKVYEITKYIKENFSNKDLSIQMIADYVHFSQTYLCSFFKKSTGNTLNEYITDVRIEKAKELLQDNSIKLYEVALRIGFTDSNYFSTLFKKIVGCSPSEYREKYRL